MTYNSSKGFQEVLSRFWGTNISHMEIVYGATLFYCLLILGIFLGVDAAFPYCMLS
jgi:hypothetical protein